MIGKKRLSLVADDDRTVVITAKRPRRVLAFANPDSFHTHPIVVRHAAELGELEVRFTTNQPGIIFFVLEPSVLDLVSGDASVWEHEPMQALVEQGELSAYVHDGFWQPMDTLRDRRHLEQLWASGSAPWKAWRD